MLQRNYTEQVVNKEVTWKAQNILQEIRVSRCVCMVAFVGFRFTVVL